MIKLLRNLTIKYLQIDIVMNACHLCNKILHILAIFWVKITLLKLFFVISKTFVYNTYVINFSICLTSLKNYSFNTVKVFSSKKYTHIQVFNPKMAKENIWKLKRKKKRRVCP